MRGWARGSSCAGCGRRCGPGAAGAGAVAAQDLPGRTSRSVLHQEPARPGRISLDAAWCPRRLRAGPAVRARVVRGGDRVRHRSAYRGPDGPAGAEMLLAAAGSATAVRLLSFRSGRGRSGGRSGTNGCWRSRPYCRGSPRFRLISEIKYYIGSRGRL